MKGFWRCSGKRHNERHYYRWVLCILKLPIHTLLIPFNIHTDLSSAYNGRPLIDLFSNQQYALYIGQATDNIVRDGSL